MTGEHESPDPSVHEVIGPVPAGWEAGAYDRARRRALWSLPTGLYVVGSQAVLDGNPQWNLMTASFVVQVAVAPKMLAVSIDRSARTACLVSVGRSFSVSVLGREDRAVVRRFVKPVREVEIGEDGRPTTLDGEPVRFGSTGSPVLARALAWLDVEVRHEMDLGSHVLFVGEVVAVGGSGVTGGERTVGDVLRMEDTRMNYGG
jgi:flavin reductase (DIM6/NTAB) family NADH-FMN oxidoreductase RutF